MHHHIYVHKYSPSTRRALPSHLVAQLGAGARVAWDALSPQFAAGLAVDDVACLPCGAMLGERATAPPAAMQRITVSGIPHGLGVSGVAARVPGFPSTTHTPPPPRPDRQTGNRRDLAVMYAACAASAVSK